jgi:hypothetical protein
MPRKFKLETVGKNPLPFPPPEVVEIGDLFALPGTQLSLKSFEHPDGPFSTGVEVEHKAVVSHVVGRFKVSNERGFEDGEDLPVLVVVFED